jgi:hypothetical protein
MDHTHCIKNNNKIKLISNVNNQIYNKLTTGFADYATARILVSLLKDTTAETILRSKVKTKNTTKSCTDSHRPKDNVNRKL